jgi:flagellar basal-body rod protein FlgB
VRCCANANRAAARFRLLGTLVAPVPADSAHLPHAKDHEMDSIFGVHEAALLFRARRMEVLAANLANADTPHYQARDMEFSSALASAGNATKFAVTHPRHIDAAHAQGAAALKYRVPHQPAQDGNTVETDLELARYAENAVAYQASLMFMNGKIATLRAALTGTR